MASASVPSPPPPPPRPATGTAVVGVAGVASTSRAGPPRSARPGGANAHARGRRPWGWGQRPRSDWRAITTGSHGRDVWTWAADGRQDGRVVLHAATEHVTADQRHVRRAATVLRSRTRPRRGRHRSVRQRRGRERGNVPESDREDLADGAVGQLGKCRRMCASASGTGGGGISVVWGLGGFFGSFPLRTARGHLGLVGTSVCRPPSPGVAAFPRSHTHPRARRAVVRAVVGDADGAGDPCRERWWC